MRARAIYVFEPGNNYDMECEVLRKKWSDSNFTREQHRTQLWISCLSSNAAPIGICVSIVSSSNYSVCCVGKEGKKEARNNLDSSGLAIRYLG